MEPVKRALFQHSALKEILAPFPFLWASSRFGKSSCRYFSRCLLQVLTDVFLCSCYLVRHLTGYFPGSAFLSSIIMGIIRSLCPNNCTSWDYNTQTLHICSVFEKKASWIIGGGGTHLREVSGTPLKVKSIDIQQRWGTQVCKSPFISLESIDHCDSTVHQFTGSGNKCGTRIKSDLWNEIKSFVALGLCVSLLFMLTQV